MCECINPLVATQPSPWISGCPIQAAPLPFIPRYGSAPSSSLSLSLLAAGNVLMHCTVGSELLTITLDTHLAEFDRDNTLTLVRLMTQSFISWNEWNNI